MAVPERPLSPVRVLAKGLLLFLAVNLAFVLARPSTGAFTLYHTLLPAHERFPALWVAVPQGDGSTLFERELISDLDLLFAAHVVSARTRPADEYRVFLFGDSSIWGTVLYPHETLAGQLNALGLTACDGRRVVAYNLGYPSNSATKDLLFMEYARRYQPDLAVWAFSLLAFVGPRQNVPLVEANPAATRALVETYGLRHPFDLPPASAGLWEHTLLARRADFNLAVRLQLSSLTLAMLGTDDPRIFVERDLRVRDVPRAETDFLGILPEDDLRAALALDTLRVAAAIQGPDLLLVNEPILISAGEHADVSYNSIFPRWAYDEFRAILAADAAAAGLTYLDLWDRVPADEFTTSVFHLTPQGEARLARLRADAIRTHSCR